VEPAGLRVALRIWVVAVLLLLFTPIVLIIVYAFGPSVVQTWPLRGFTWHWFDVAWNDPAVRQAFLLSVKVGLLAAGIALVLGSAVSYGLHNFRFFGREGVSLLLVLPIALPGFTSIALGVLTIVIGHATFCIVIVYNNLIARLRRTPRTLGEASMDLGARGWQTQLYVMFPQIATALVAGGLLAFALSFDEVIVTVFTAGANFTLPLWIFGQLRLGQQLPEVNAVVTIVIVLTIIPVLLAARVAGAGAVAPTARAAEVESTAPR
jgi:putative spermidine/putrescine transport system permease protein